MYQKAGIKTTKEKQEKQKKKERDGAAPDQLATEACMLCGVCWYGWDDCVCLRSAKEKKPTRALPGGIESGLRSTTTTRSQSPHHPLTLRDPMSAEIETRQPHPTTRE